MRYTIKDEKYYIDDKIVDFQPHLLPNDEVEIVNDKVILKKRFYTRIVGVLKTNDKSFVGKSPKHGIFLKEFIPADSSLPTMMARTKIKWYKTNKYVIVEPMDYDSSTKKIRCSIQINIGNVGDSLAEENYILHANKCYYKKHEPVLDTEFIDPFSDHRIDFTKKEVISIDPPECEDIDDAFHVEMLDDNALLVGVHIADVTSYIPYESKIDNNAQIRGTTVYLPTRRIDMLPSEYSTNICSLKEKVPKRVTSILITFKDNRVIDYKIQKSSIIVKHNYSYEEFDSLTHSSNIKSLITMAKNMYPKIICGDIRKIIPYNKKNFDSHYLIEFLMVLSNSFVGKFLSKYKNLYRVSNGITGFPIHKDPYNISSYMMVECTKFGSSGEHKMIGTQNYVYFTSPIRRYADIYTHRLINYALGTDIDPQKNYEDLLIHLNEKDRSSKKVQRESKKIQLLKMFNGADSLEFSESYIVSFDKETKRLKLYISELESIFTMNVLNKKIDSYGKILIDYDEKKGIIMITNTENDYSYSIKVGTKIPFKVFLFNRETSINKKFKFKIDDPKFNFILSF